VTAADCEAGSAVAGGAVSGPPRIRPPPAMTRFAAASMSPTQHVAHGGIADRIEECGGRRCRDAPRPAGVGSCGGEVTLQGAVGRVTTVDCEAGPAGRRRSWGGDVTLPGAARGVTTADCEADSAVAGGAVTLPGRPASARAAAM